MLFFDKEPYMSQRLLSLLVVLSFLGSIQTWGKSALLDWNHFHDVDWNYSIDTPFPLLKDGKMSGYDSVFYATPVQKGANKGFEMKVGVTFFPDSKKTMTVDETPKQVADLIAAEKKVTDLKLFETPFIVKGIRFLVSNGTATDKAGKTVKFKILNAVLLPYWWRVIIQYDPAREIQENIANRIVSSFEINP
jgi:hypothetical protein